MSDSSNSVIELGVPGAGAWDVDENVVVPEIPSIGVIDEINNSKGVFISFKSALEFLPKEFDGHNMSVLKFVKNCRFAEESIVPQERSHLYKIIRSRIVGDAENSIQNHEITNLNELLNYLKNVYIERKSMSQLNSVLATVAQNEDEDVLKYSSRVGEVLNEITELLQEDNGVEGSIEKVKSIRETALGNFILGLKKELILRVRLEKPRTLAEAIKIAREAEWEIKFQGTLARKSNEKVDKKLDNSTINVNNPRWHHNARFQRSSRVQFFNKAQKGQQNQVKVDTAKSGETNQDRICYICKKKGHISRDCPQKKIEQDQPQKKQQVECFYCGKKGHVKRECWKLLNKGKVMKLECSKCGRSGHNVEKCWGACSICKKFGHPQENCWSKREVKNEETKDENVKENEQKN